MADAKTVSLTIGERAAALKLFDAFKGTTTALVMLMDDIKPFPISAEEWETAGLVKTPNNDGTEQWKWSDDKVLKDIPLQETTVAYLKDEIKKKNDAGDITLADIALVSLEKKL